MGLIGSAASLAGTIFGGISTRKKMKKVENNLNDQMRKNEDWYNRRYNEDATQRADAQALLTQTRDALRENTQRAEGTQAVMGGTEESVAATKAANAKALADAASQINQQADTRKDAIENEYLSTDRSLNNQLNDLTLGEAQQTQAAVAGVKEAANGLGTFSFEDKWLSKNNSDNTTK